MGWLRKERKKKKHGDGVGEILGIGEHVLGMVDDCGDFCEMGMGDGGSAGVGVSVICRLPSKLTEGFDRPIAGLLLHENLRRELRVDNSGTAREFEFRHLCLKGRHRAESS